MKYTALLALADGTLFWGKSLGVSGESTGEVVFNTSLTGYQEILTDPSYFKQLVTLTYPHIGNVGVNTEDAESSSIMAQGLIIKDYSLAYSNFRAEKSLSEYLIEQNIVAISDIDTRKLTRHLRNKGSQSGVIISKNTITQENAEKAILQAAKFKGLKGLDLAKHVSTEKTYTWNEGIYNLGSNGKAEYIDHSKTATYHVVVYDYGVKHNILRMLADRNCRLTVVPAKTPASDVLKLKPDGVFLSNGPGDPKPCYYAIEAIKEILKLDIPIFGICLGHQLLALASGAKTIKMKFGHHGANHPVQDLKTKKVMITSQNHGFSVDDSCLPDNLIKTHKSLFDQTLQGIERKDKLAFSVQGHPEASPGPQDMSYLFDKFITNIKKYKC